ncbi:MAG: hypothetical protein LBJ76_05510 [Candidatus Accumulibacter sp.]|nr:hypothetical protein [Accumulibacter sp.]
MILLPAADYSPPALPGKHYWRTPRQESGSQLEFDCCDSAGHAPDRVGRREVLLKLRNPSI